MSERDLMEIISALDRQNMEGGPFRYIISDQEMNLILRATHAEAIRECDAALRKVWHSLVEKHNLQPGSVVEEFAGEAMRAIRALS